MTGHRAARWGIIGTANIARGAFLPALRQAGGGAVAVASRHAARAEQYAREQGIDRAVEGYQRLIDDPDIDALYIALPNSLHAEWTIRALRAGRPVLCEKPLCGTLAETEQVLAVARDTGTLLWEAFVFLFHGQFERMAALVADGAIGELREIQSTFHFTVSSPGNIRFAADLRGGALNDVGCYPIRLARSLFGADHESAWATAEWGGQGVDVECWGILGFPGGRKLLLSAGLRRDYDTFTRLLGTSGQIRMTNPFHPGAGDHYEVHAAGSQAGVLPAGADEPSFTAAIRHINAVLAGEAEPRLLAVDTSLSLARAVHDLAESAERSRSPEGPERAARAGPRE